MVGVVYLVGKRVDPLTDSRAYKWGSTFVVSLIILTDAAFAGTWLTVCEANVKKAFDFEIEQGTWSKAGFYMDSGMWIIVFIPLLIQSAIWILQILMPVPTIGLERCKCGSSKWALPSPP